MVGVASPPRLADRSALQGGGPQARNGRRRGAKAGGDLRPLGGASRGRSAAQGEGAGTQAAWALHPPAPPRPGVQDGSGVKAAGWSGQGGQDSALIWRASAKSAPVRPPAECVDNVKVTLFHWISTSGWWLACSAR